MKRGGVMCSQYLATIIYEWSLPEHALHDESYAKRVEQAVLLGDALATLVAVRELAPPLQQCLEVVSLFFKPISTTFYTP